MPEYEVANLPSQLQMISATQETRQLTSHNADADFAGVDAHVLLDRVSPGQQILNQIRYLGLHSRQWMSPP